MTKAPCSIGVQYECAIGVRCASIAPRWYRTSPLPAFRGSKPLAIAPAHALRGSLKCSAPEAQEQVINCDPHYDWAALCCLRLRMDGSGGDAEAGQWKGRRFCQVPGGLGVAGDDPITGAGSGVRDREGS